MAGGHGHGVRVNPNLFHYLEGLSECFYVKAFIHHFKSIHLFWPVFIKNKLIQAGEEEGANSEFRIQLHKRTSCLPWAVNHHVAFLELMRF